MARISNIALLNQGEQPLLSIRKKTRIADIPQILGYCFGKIGTYLENNNEIPSEIPYVCFHGVESMDENNMDVEVRIPIARLLPAYEDIESHVLPEGKVIFCMYQGDYNEITPVYEEMNRWIKENGYTSCNQSWETYYNGPEYTEEKLLTRVAMPIK